MFAFLFASNNDKNYFLRKL